MGTQKMSGLTKRGGTWHIDKVFRGTRIRESTGTGEIVKAQELLAKRIDEIRAAQLYGARPDRTFRAAATKFLNENQHKSSHPPANCSASSGGSSQPNAYRARLSPTNAVVTAISSSRIRAVKMSRIVTCR